MGVDYLVILGFSELFMCWEILVEGAYAGFGHTLPASVLSTVFTALRIPAAVSYTHLDVYKRQVYGQQFGQVERPLDGLEQPMQNWADLSGRAGGQTRCV